MMQVAITVAINGLGTTQLHVRANRKKGSENGKTAGQRHTDLT
jgi:hypothetical protein